MRISCYDTVEDTDIVLKICTTVPSVVLYEDYNKSSCTMPTSSLIKTPCVLESMP